MREAVQRRPAHRKPILHNPAELRRMEGRGFSPAVEFRWDLGALAPEATLLQGLKAHSTLRPGDGGPKAPPSRGSQIVSVIKATSLLSQ